jgi:predicted Holliday junction resolvase-like endonuclease
MQVLEKSENKIKKMKFANTAYVLIISMTLVSSIKFIKEEYDRDMHIKTFVHVAIDKKMCDIEEHFGIMTLEFNLINESTTTVKMTTPNKKIEMLNNQASTKEKEMKKTSQSITNSEQITHEKSDKEHIMKLNQSDEKQQKNLSLNNSHSSRQVNSGGDEDHLIKTSNTKNDDRRKRFIKTPNLKNDGLKKQAKLSDITHHKNLNRTQKA